MRVILIAEDPLLRDQLLVGFEHCPGVRVEVLEKGTAFERVRSGDVDVVFIECTARRSWEDVAREIPEIDGSVEIVLIHDPRLGRKALKEKKDLDVHNFLASPIEADAFYRLMGRMRTRMRRLRAAGHHTTMS